jgi:hypothetical protein
MFFSVSKIEQTAHRVTGISNPKNIQNPMTLGIYRNLVRTALFSGYSKKSFSEYWDDTERKKISKRLWTAEMHDFARRKEEAAPRPPFIFKLTVVGWLFVLCIVAMLGLTIYESVKPDTPKTAAYIAMEAAPAEGDIYFGHYESFRQAGDRVASGLGFGWFKVIGVEGDLYYIARSTEMSSSHKPKEQLNSSDFETEGIPVRITEQHGYMINMKSVDEKTQVYITEKK